MQINTATALSTTTFNSPSPPTSSTLIADTGCSAHFCTPTHTLVNVQRTDVPVQIRIPDGTCMESTHHGELDIPALPVAARRAHIVPALTGQSLISIGQLCDAGCDVSFNATSVDIQLQGTPIFSGTRTPDTKLWTLTASPQPTVPVTAPVEQTYNAFANAAVGAPTASNLVTFAHAALFSPALTTLEIALKKGYINNFPGLTATTLRKYPPTSRAMVKGHMDQIRKNVRSTQVRTTHPSISDNYDYYPKEQPHVDNNNTVFADLLDVPDSTGKIFTDQPGRFIAPSSTGNNYIFILYDYDSNAILAEPMPSKTAASILTAYKKLHGQLVAAGRTPRLQRIDNECSESLQQYMTSQNITYQLVPPGMHRRNAAERAIRTFKNHFIAGLSSTDSNFPIHLWDKLLEQAIITLNLLRGSRVNPSISAWAQLFGQFDFNATPIAPPGINVLVHDKPNERDSWAPHASAGWYIGPAMKSYRCFRCYMQDTQAVRITDTIAWFPDRLPVPTPSTDELILAGIHAIHQALIHPTADSTIAPLAPATLTALQNINAILHQVAAPTQVAPVLVPPRDDAPLSSVSVQIAAPLRVPTVPVIAPTPTPVSLPPPVPVSVPVPESPVPDTTPAPLRVVIPPVIAPSTFATLTNRRARRSQTRRTKRQAAKIAALVTAAITPPTLQEPTIVTPVSTRPRRRTVTQRFNKRTHQPEYAANASVTVTQFESYESAFLGHAVNPDTGLIANYKTLRTCSQGEHWEKGCAEEFGRLLNGDGTTTTTGTNTMRFVDPNTLPANFQSTYLTLVTAYRPEKPQPYRVRGVVGGDRLTYEGDCSTKASAVDTVKIHLNHVVSTPNGRYATTDVKDFYLNTPMDEKDWVYLRIPIDDIPKCILDYYQPVVRNGYVYAQVQKGMYGLKQAGKLANDLLITNLAKYGYAPVPVTPGLWKHNTRAISFTLVVDDFGIAYSDPNDLTHLLDALQQHYKISTDMSGRAYIGLTIDWDYTQRTVDISMPGYIERALLRFKHATPPKAQHSPHRSAQPIYGKQQQLTPEPDTTPLLNAADNKTVQEIIGTLLYYARAVDPTLLTALSTLATQQTKGTQQTMKDIAQLLNYCATHPNAVIRYKKSDMILHVESDASYLSESKARSRVAGYYYLSNNTTNNTAFDDTDYVAMPNGPVHVLCQIMKEVVSSAAEAEVAGLFHNARDACPMRIALEELGHPQPPTPLQTDNSTACGIANDTVKQRRSKAIDMRFYWIRDRVRQGQFFIYWRKGSINLADYFTKHHAASHHIAIRSTILQAPSSNRFALLASTL